MQKNICLFEDNHTRFLRPLVNLRPVFELRCGALSLKQKLEKRLLTPVSAMIVRKILKELTTVKYQNVSINNLPGGEFLFVNGRLVLDDRAVHEIRHLKRGHAIEQDGTIVAVSLPSEAIPAIKFDSAGYPDFESALKGKTQITGIRLVNFPWDLITYNHDELQNDFAIFPAMSDELNPDDFPCGRIYIAENIKFGENLEIMPGAILDASSGPIIIGNNVKIMHNAVIQGPAFIGDGSTIKMGATIYHNTSIGAVCKVGGEVEDSIIHGYSNKQHEGFLGHSYLGEWVNLGAGTNNSDLKNNYGNIRVKLNNVEFDTGLQFVGLTMGDHSKCAIGTQFNTGTVVGTACNIFGNGFPPKYIPSFSWGGSEGLTEYAFEKAIETAKKVMARRDIQMLDCEETLLRQVYENSSSERESLNKNV